MPGTQCSRDEEVLRQVLLGLGFEEDELSDLHDVEGVDWRLGLQGWLFRIVCQTS